MKSGQGILYAATGKKYLREVGLSALSVKRHMPDIATCLVTDHLVEIPGVDKVVVMDLTYEGHKGIKLYKPNALIHSPFEKTLFLDSDTYMCAPCYELFSMTDRVDIALAHDTADMSTPLVEGQELLGFHPYNSGVVSLGSGQKIDRFLSDWYKILESEYEVHPWDQRAMMSSIVANDITTLVLQPVYNCRTNFIVSLPQLPVKIIHGRGIDFAAVELDINAQRRNRVWMPKRMKTAYKKKSSFLDKVFQKVRTILGGT